MRSPADLLFEGFGRGISRIAAAADPDLPEMLRESEGRTLALVVRGTDRVLEVEVRDGSLRVLPPRRLPDGATGSAVAAETKGTESTAGPSGEPPTEDVASPLPADAGRPPDSNRNEEHRAPALRPEGPGDLPGGADLVLAGSVPDFVRFLLAIRREPAPEDPFAGLEVRGSAASRRAFVDLLRRVDPDHEALLARVAGGVVAHAMSRTTVGRLWQARRSAERLVDDLTEYLEEETRLVPEPAARARFADGVRALHEQVAELEGRLDRASRRD